MENKYVKYFERKGRKDGTVYYALNENRPEELYDLVYDIHLIFDALPCDWIYETIFYAFNEYDEYDDKDDFVDQAQVVIYNNELRNWLGEPGAHDSVNEAIQEGLTEGSKDINSIIQAGNCLAVQKIYEAVRVFMEEHESESD